MKNESRIIHLDIMRGIAISLMIMANSVAAVYGATPPLWMRFLGSFAAPSFMMLVGMMLAFSTKPKPLRGLKVIALGCLMDVLLWKIMPFMTFDVLYTIGISILISAYPARYLSVKALGLSAVLIFLIGDLLRLTLGYQNEIIQVSLVSTTPIPPFADIAYAAGHYFLIDGWFPLFPWLGFVWAGAALQKALYQAQAGLPARERLIYPRKWGLIALVFFMLAAIYWEQHFVVPEPRIGYSELFYPANADFCFMAASAFFIVLYVLQAITRWRSGCFALAPFNSLGQRSLWIYVFHELAITYVIEPYFETSDLNRFLMLALMLWVSCVLLSRLLIAFTIFNKKKTALALQQTVS